MYSIARQNIYKLINIPFFTDSFHNCILSFFFLMILKYRKIFLTTFNIIFCVILIQSCWLIHSPQHFVDPSVYTLFTCIPLSISCFSFSGGHQSMVLHRFQGRNLRGREERSQAQRREREGEKKDRKRKER